MSGTAPTIAATAPAALRSEVGGLPPQPYPGLRPFKTSEWRIFCGREAVTREVLYKLGDHNVVLVHGGSGCGKSSLILAGVLPSLERDMRLAGSHLVSATIRPSQGPLAALAATLARLLGPMPGAGTGEPVESRADPDGAAQRTAAAGWTSALLFAPDIVERIEAAIAAKDDLPDEKIDLLCLVIDQFEEIFPWARERRASDVEALCRLLAALARPGAGRRLVIIVTMRSDFLGQCALFPALGEVINSCQYFLPGLEDRMLERAIRDPAHLFGGKIEDALVTRLKTEASGALDALPVLQHSLMRMAAPKLNGGAKEWVLTLEDFRTVTTEPAGGCAPPTFVSNALSVHAEEIRAGLVARDGAAGAAVEAVFRALFDSEGGRLVRRPTDLDRLIAMAGEAGPQVTRVIDDYAREGNDLLIRIDDSETGRPRIDISHEALLRNWWRMKFGENGKGLGWIEAEADDALVWRTLALMAETKTVLPRRLLVRWREQIRRFRAAPVRALRYLLRSEDRKDADQQPEWLSVMDFAKRSETRVKLWNAVTVLSALLVLVSLLYRLTDIWETSVRDEKISQSAEQQITRLDNERKFLVESATKAVADQNLDSKYRLTDDEVALLDLAAPTTAPTAVQSATGYVWIGDGEPTNLLPDPTAAPVQRASDIVVGKTYFLQTNLALRATLPSAGNRSQRISALQEGTPVIAQMPATRAANGQYWLKVRPIQTATVYLQYGSGDPAAAQLALVAAGFKVPPAEQLATAEGTNEIRYCHAADQQSATNAATALAKQRGTPVPVRWIGKGGGCAKVTQVGTIEAWVGNTR